MVLAMASFAWPSVMVLKGSRLLVGRSVAGMKNFASVKEWELNILISFTLKKHATACETLVLYDLTFYLHYSVLCCI